MAKNLQSVLNSVVNDLLQEAEFGVAKPSGFEGLGGNSNGYLDDDFEHKVTGGMGYVTMDQAAKEKAIRDEMELKAGLDELKPHAPYNDLYRQRYIEQMENPTLASVSGVDGENGIVTPYKEAMYKARHGLDAVKQWIADNPGLALGAGALGGSALAAGAGALYLRKKQRDANRRAGR